MEKASSDYKPSSYVAVYGSRRQDGYMGAIRTLMETLLRAGISIGVEKKLASLLNDDGFRLPLHGIETCTALPPQADAIISIGGDGTFLRAAHWTGGREIPVLGINTGHLGFLAANSIDDPEKILGLLKGDGVVERRMVIQARSEADPSRPLYALNEVAFLKGQAASMLDIRVEVDGDYLADYRADGLLMATPTGSTAYNLSVGGPILVPTLKNIILSPVAPHMLTLRPLVVGADAVIRATVSSRAGSFNLSIDGHSVPMSCDSAVEIRKAPHCVVTLHGKDENFATTLRTKLLWGHSRVGSDS